jgi:hypothetical protein
VTDQHLTPEQARVLRQCGQGRVIRHVSDGDALDLDGCVDVGDEVRWLESAGLAGETPGGRWPKLILPTAAGGRWLDEHPEEGR